VCNFFASLEEERTPKNVVLAPSGIAAMSIGKRVESANVRTVHSWIVSTEVSPGENKFKFINYLHVDEAGMLDLWVTWHLLQAAERQGVQQIGFSGDCTQLPPVAGCGTIFRELLSLTGDNTPTQQHLKQNYRTASVPGLHGLLEKMRYLSVRAGTLTRRDFNTDDSKLFVIENSFDSDGLFRELFRQLDGIDKEKVKIICNRKDGLITRYGGDSLKKRNSNLCTLYNSFNNVPTRTDRSSFHKGDKVFSGVNITNPTTKELIVANGSMGIITKDFPIVTVEFPNDKDPTCNNQFSQDCKSETTQKLFEKGLTNASVSTVHKFQGSEEDTIIACFTGKSDSFNSIQLLYTASSRAKKKLIIIMEKQTLAIYTKPDRKPNDKLGNKHLRSFVQEQKW
jgi:exodeoxyribonuclease V alpha subunit